MISPACPFLLAGTGISGSKRREGEGLLKMSPSSPIPRQELIQTPIPPRGPTGCPGAAALVWKLMNQRTESNRSCSPPPPPPATSRRMEVGGVRASRRHAVGGESGFRGGGRKRGGGDWGGDRGSTRGSREEIVDTLQQEGSLPAEHLISTIDPIGRP
jgi:hypothetical protein